MVIFYKVIFDYNKKAPVWFSYVYYEDLYAHSGNVYDETDS